MTMTPTARSRAAEAPPGPVPTTEELHGQASLQAAAAELTELATRCGSPITAQATWLLATIGALPDQQSWAVLARDPEGSLVGAVVLLDRSEGLQETVTLTGTDEGQRGAILTDRDTVALALGQAVGQALYRRRLRPAVELGPLPAASPVVEAFVLGLHGSAQVPAPWVPVIRRTDASGVDAYLSHGMRRTVRKATNRLDRDQLSGTVQFTRNAAQIIDLLPKIEECHRDRDHMHGRLSDLDDDQQRRLWHHRIHALVRSGELELATLHIDDMFAAYAMGIVDGPVYRLLEGRLDTKWARYSPGRLLEAAVVQRMLDDPALDTLDWMTAVASEALLALNDADPMVVVRMAGDPRPHAELRGATAG